jgi:hypothetical protein
MSQGMNMYFIHLAFFNRLSKSLETLPDKAVELLKAPCFLICARFSRCQHTLRDI